ncbi:MULTISPECIES: flagellar basal body-associated FliL family protein [Acetobacter]|jgi:flagellar FliL protein|uniref:flagellar basal body-associated FliL family protein n=1 Tax=Acetobacter TaxID=434 RepID=UPI00376FAB7A
MSETVTGAREADAAAAVPRADAPKSKRKLMMAGAAGLVLLIGGGVFWEKDKIFTSKLKQNVGSKAEAAMHPPVLVGIPPMVSNLDTSGGHPVYVKLTAKVEVSGVPNEAALQDRIAEIQDVFQTYLHETRPQDIRGNGIYRLREAILRRLRAQLAPVQVTNLYLVEFLVQ